MPTHFAVLASMGPGPKGREEPATFPYFFVGVTSFNGARP